MEGELHGVVEQVDHLDALGGLGLEVDGQREVEPAGAQPLDALRGRGLTDRQLDARVASAEGVYGAGEDARAGSRERRHAEVAPAELGERLERGLRRLELAEDDLGVLRQELACLGEHDAAGAALEQPHAGFTLERGDLLGDGRGGVGQHVGGAGERAAPRDLPQHTQSADVQHEGKVTARGWVVAGDVSPGTAR